MDLVLLFSFISSLFLLISAQPPPAPQIENNPHMVTYQAILNGAKPIQGSITGVSAVDGKGVDFNVNFFSFPDPSIGPYGAFSTCDFIMTCMLTTNLAYHVHVNPVPEDGNCTAAGGHLDPYTVTDAYQCPAATDPQTCQIGDLAGKHGKIDTTTLQTASYQKAYLDLFLSTTKDNTAFFGNRSVVVHAANGTRLNCGNFVLQSADMGHGNNGSTNGTQTSSGPSGSPTKTGVTGGPAVTPTETTPPPGSNEGVAGIRQWSVSAVLGMGVAALAMVAL